MLRPKQVCPCHTGLYNPFSYKENWLYHSWSLIPFKQPAIKQVKVRAAEPRSPFFCKPFTAHVALESCISNLRGATLAVGENLCFSGAGAKPSASVTPPSTSLSSPAWHQHRPSSSAHGASLLGPATDSAGLTLA